MRLDRSGFQVSVFQTYSLELAAMAVCSGICAGLQRFKGCMLEVCAWAFAILRTLYNTAQHRDSHSSELNRAGCEKAFGDFSAV